jgi:4-hydroxy-3-methylbut-2-enyl diphosphate reductase IspH
LAPEVDVMIVVGGKNSANTNRLTEICEALVPTYHVEVASDISPEWFIEATIVGLTAGASTPEWVIQEVKSRLESL